MKIEYLVLSKIDGSFCDSESAFLSLLKADSRIDITKKQIKYEPLKGGDKFYVNYKLKSDIVFNKEERYFLLELDRVDSSREQDFVELTRKLKKIIEKINPGKVKINTLLDEISQKYAKEAYPIINELENLMRKLISQFMLINVGTNWSKKAMHNDILSKIDSKKETSTHFDDIYMTDFIHLSDFLFKKYRSVNVNELDKMLDLSKTKNDINYSRLKKFLPLSNWERHFSTLIDFSEDKLKSYWEKLYSYRNKVAHNRGLTFNDLKEIKILANKVKETLKKAISSLDKLKIKEEEKEIITQQTDWIVSNPKNYYEYLFTKRDDLNKIQIDKNQFFFKYDTEGLEKNKKYIELVIETLIKNFKDDPEKGIAKLEEMKSNYNPDFIDLIISEFKKIMK